MKRTTFCAILLFSAAAAAAETPVDRVADDAKVIERVAQAAKRDLPQDLLKRILLEDIEWLRGKHADGTYDHAVYERFEASRSDESYSVQTRKDDTLSHFEIRGAFVYRLLIDVPSRKLLVTRNRHVFIDHVEVEYVPMTSSTTQRHRVKIESWMEPGQSRTVDLPEVARQATVTVHARADDQAGYGNIVMTLLKARVIDSPSSPYADAVASAKAMMRAVDNSDIPSIRSLAARIHDGLAGKAAPVEPAVAPAVQSIEVIAPRSPASPTVQAVPPSGDLHAELQSIEDLLTGTDAEKRQGLDRLHQLVRRFRPR